MLKFIDESLGGREGCTRVQDNRSRPNPPLSHPTYPPQPCTSTQLSPNPEAVLSSPNPKPGPLRSLYHPPLYHPLSPAPLPLWVPAQTSSGSIVCQTLTLITWSSSSPQALSLSPSLFMPINRKNDRVSILCYVISQNHPKR